MNFSELVFIMVLGLVLFGPEELPKIARSIGKIIYEVKQASADVQREVRKAVMEQPASQPANGSAVNQEQAEQSKSVLNNEPPEGAIIDMDNEQPRQEIVTNGQNLTK